MPFRVVNYLNSAVISEELDFFDESITRYSLLYHTKAHKSNKLCFSGQTGQVTDPLMLAHPELNPNHFF